MRRVHIWIAASTILAIFLMLEYDITFNSLSPSSIQETGTYPYAVLALCFVMLYLKREKIIAAMQNKIDLLYAVAGISLACIALLLPASELPFQILAILLLVLGVFTALFGKAAIVPSALLGIYSFSLVFPYAVSVPGNTYPMATLIILVTILSPFLQISNNGQYMQFIDSGGSAQTYYIDAACSGSASLSMFFSLFFLMMMDTPLPGKKAIHMLIFGVAGTSLQNILRLVFLVLSGYWYGSGGIWTAHRYAGYILFPAWFMVFAYIYMKNAGRI